MKLIVSDLASVRGGEKIFADISFEVAQGEVLIITGHNGSGKSTLLRIVADLLPNAGGDIKLEGRPDGAPISFDEKPLREHCHYLGPENAMKPALSVEENLLFWQRMDDEPHLSVDEAIDMVGLGSLNHVPFGHLSTGQKRRIAIARLLVSWRPIWLLDEPTSGLDRRSEAQFADLMRVHIEDGGIVLAATHIPLGLENSGSLVMDRRRSVGA